MSGLVLIIVCRDKKIQQAGKKTGGVNLHLAPKNKEVHQAAVTVFSEKLRVICIQIIRAQHFKNTGARGVPGKR